ncbi:hypothetical protein Tco_1182585 [Tanacetum coccineum]
MDGCLLIKRGSEIGNIPFYSLFSLVVGVDILDAFNQTIPLNRDAILDSRQGLPLGSSSSLDLPLDKIGNISRVSRRVVVMETYQQGTCMPPQGKVVTSGPGTSSGDGGAWARFNSDHAADPRLSCDNATDADHHKVIMPPRKAPITRTTPATTTNTTSVTNAQLQIMIDQGVAATLATRDANRSTNGEDSHNSRTGVKRTESVARECTYQDIMKCQPLFFKGTEGVCKTPKITTTQWNTTWGATS